MKLTFCLLYSLSIFSYFLPWWRLPASSFRRCYTFSSTFYVNILLMSTFSLLYHSSNASCAVRTCSPNAKLFFIFLSVGLNIPAHHLTAVNNSLCPLLHYVHCRCCRELTRPYTMITKMYLSFTLSFTYLHSGIRPGVNFNMLTVFDDHSRRDSKVEFQMYCRDHYPKFLPFSYCIPLMLGM